jgi:hypothetical protein
MKGILLLGCVLMSAIGANGAYVIGSNGAA